MIMNQDEQKRPISPQDLFERLLNGNFKESECVDEATIIRQQRDVLISLIEEYSAEISKRLAERDGLEELIETRARLKLELEQLRAERISIDRNLAEEVNRLKMNPLQIKERSEYTLQLNQTKAKNAKLGIRLRELTQYCAKIQNYNHMLQQQGKIITMEIGSLAASQHVEIEDWRRKIELMKQERSDYSNKIRQKLRQRSEMSLREIQHQQAQIQQRNRQRMQTFQEKSRFQNYY